MYLTEILSEFKRNFQSFSEKKISIKDYFVNLARNIGKEYPKVSQRKTKLEQIKGNGKKKIDFILFLLNRLL